MRFSLAFAALFALCLSACMMDNKPPADNTAANPDHHFNWKDGFDQSRADIYTSVQLTTDLSALNETHKQVIPILIEVAGLMDEMFWAEAYGDKDELLSGIQDEKLRRFAEVNYGPWDRLDDNTPFIDGFDQKPLGANYYPADMTKEEFEAWDDPNKASLYTMVVREDSTLKSVWYHEYFAEQVERAAALLDSASALAMEADPEFAIYLEARAKSLRTDRYNPSDVGWLQMESNVLDFIVGPIENYEDHLYNYKAAHEAYVLVKDVAWSERLKRYKALLPRLQEELPVDAKYKQDAIGGNAQLNAYDVIYYAGDCNSGSKTIAVNLPNDEGLQQQYGTRRSQLKNAMQAKYDKILLPIAEVLIATDQRKHITFDAFFSNTMFHEVAHGLGIKNTINDQGTVRDALKEQSSWLEEGKADILGLWMVTKLREWDEVSEGELMDNYVTFLAGIFRSVRFGAASAHGKANMLRFNFFEEAGAFTYDDVTQTYAVDAEKMGQAVEDLSRMIIELQGDGAYLQVKEISETKAVIGNMLQSQLDRLSSEGIPVDVVFEQGVDVLGL